jgi:NAD(P)-dependent dehydrogenase (short-subunit alcohol dehydrogenase family)
VAACWVVSSTVASGQVTRRTFFTRAGAFGALNAAQSAIAAMQGADHGVLVFTVNSLARSPEAMSAALSIGKGAQLNLALSLERELEGTPIHVGVVTVCGPIKAGTAYDPDRLANVYWELATQEPARFERDRLVQAPDSSLA